MGIVPNGQIKLTCSCKAPAPSEARAVSAKYEVFSILCSYLRLSFSRDCHRRSLAG